MGGGGGGGGGRGENTHMIEQLNENLSLNVPTNHNVDCRLKISHGFTAV